VHGQVEQNKAREHEPYVRRRTTGGQFRGHQNQHANRHADKPDDLHMDPAETRYRPQSDEEPEEQKKIDGATALSVSKFGMSASESFSEGSSPHLYGRRFGGLLLWEVLVLYRFLASGNRIAAAHHGTLQCVNHVLRALPLFVALEILGHVVKVILFL